jgi:hypothetical protein
VTRRFMKASLVFGVALGAALLLDWPWNGAVLVGLCSPAWLRPTGSKAGNSTAKAVPAAHGAATTAPAHRYGRMSARLDARMPG